MSWSEMWTWKLDTPLIEPAGARISAGKSGSVAMSWPIHSPFDRYLVGMTEPSTTTRFDGEIAELLLYDRALPDCERDQIVDDLGAQYGIVVSVTGAECVPPGDPTGLSATPFDYRQIDLSWTAGSADEDGFKVERRLGQTGTWSEIVDLGAGVTSYRWRPFQHMTANGVSGNPTRATVEKGEQLLEAAAEALTALITDPDTWSPPRDLRGDGVAGVEDRIDAQVGPFDPDRRVVPADPRLGLAVVDTRGQVLDVGVIGEHAESPCEGGWCP